MASNDNPDAGDGSGSSDDKSNLVEVVRILVPALSAIVVAYFGYLQITQPKALEIAATQTAMSVAAASLATTPEPATPPATAPTEAVATESAATEPAATAAATQPPTETPAPTLTSEPTSEATLTSAPTPATPTAQAALAPTPGLSQSGAAESGTNENGATENGMVMITAKDGGQPFAVLPETLRFQGHPGLELRSGEWVPFTNIQVIEIGQVRLGAIPIEITFTDGLTQSASLTQYADFLEGETPRGTFQTYMEQLTRLELPNPSQPPRDTAQEGFVTFTTKGGDSAQVIASTLRFQATESLNLRSGEWVPFANILSLRAGTVKAGAVPIELTFTDGLTQSASLVQYADIFEGESLHGSFLISTENLREAQFPNAPQAGNTAANEEDAFVTLTTPEQDMAQVIASTLRYQDNTAILLSTGEVIPFDEMATIEVTGAGSGDNVPIVITFTDGVTQSTTSIKYADLFQGETRHGGYLKYLSDLELISFANEE